MRADEFVGRLDRVLGRGPTWRAQCPAHNSKAGTRTLSIKEAPDGRILLRCFAGCDVASITAAVGVDLTDLMPDRPEGGKRIRGAFSREGLLNMEKRLMLVWVFVEDIASGRAPAPGDRAKARECARRVAEAIQQLR